MRKAACLENDSRMKVSQRQPRVVAGDGRINVDRLLKLNNEPTADDEQNGGESQPQRSVRDMNCHPAADHNTGDGAGESDPRMVVSTELMIQWPMRAISVNGTTCAMAEPTMLGVESRGQRMISVVTRWPRLQLTRSKQARRELRGRRPSGWRPGERPAPGSGGRSKR
jgi:hypothetical protein